MAGGGAEDSKENVFKSDIFQGSGHLTGAWHTGFAILPMMASGVLKLFYSKVCVCLYY